MSLQAFQIPARTPSARARGRSVVAFESPKYLRRGRDLLAEALVATRLGGKFTGGDLSDRDRRRLVDRLIVDARAELDSLARRLDEGSLGLGTWHRRSAELLAGYHHASALAGLGRTGLDAAEKADLYRTLDRELGYLARFRGELQAGVVGIGDMAAARARMYGSALWGGAEESRRQAMAREGYGFERRHLGSPERHCTACPDLAARGWAPIGTLPAIGDTPCRTNCRCTYSYRKSDPATGEAPPPPPSVADIEQELGVTFERSQAGGAYRLVAVEVDRLFASLGLDPDNLATDPGRIAEFGRFVERARREGIPIEPAKVALDVHDQATVVNGRNRLAFLRLFGARWVPVLVPREEAVAFRRRFG